MRANESKLRGNTTEGLRGRPAAWPERPARTEEAKLRWRERNLGRLKDGSDASPRGSEDSPLASWGGESHIRSAPVC